MKSGFIFCLWKFWIRTRPDWIFSFENFESGHVRIEFFPLKILNPDASGLNFFHWKFWIRTRPDWIFLFKIFESGHVRISIPDFIFYPPYERGIFNPPPMRRYGIIHIFIKHDAEDCSTISTIMTNTDKPNTSAWTDAKPILLRKRTPPAATARLGERVQ